MLRVYYIFWFFLLLRKIFLFIWQVLTKIFKKTGQVWINLDQEGLCVYLSLTLLTVSTLLLSKYKSWQGGHGHYIYCCWQASPCIATLFWWPPASYFYVMLMSHLLFFICHLTFISSVHLKIDLPPNLVPLTFPLTISCLKTTYPQQHSGNSKYLQITFIRQIFLKTNAPPPLHIKILDLLLLWDALYQNAFIWKEHVYLEEVVAHWIR